MVNIPTNALTPLEEILLYDTIWKYLDENLAPCSDFRKMQATAPCCMSSLYNQTSDSESTAFWVVHKMADSIKFWTEPTSYESLILLKFGVGNGQTE